jgi:hypothetical protein
MVLTRCGLLLVLWLALAGRVAAAPVAAGPVLQHKIGPSAGQAFYLAEALRKLERPADAAALERYLVHAYVQDLAGERHDAQRTVEQALAIAAQLPPPEQSLDLRTRWRQQLNARLVLELPGASRPLPAEMETIAPQLKELAPGLWGAMNGPRPRALYLFTAFANHSMVTLALSEFQMEVVHKAGTEALKFTCAPERDKATPSVVAAGQRADFLCRSTAIPANESADKPAQVLAQARERQLLRLDSRELDDARSIARLAKALAATRANELAALLAKAAAATPPPAAAAAAVTPNAAGAAAAKPKDGWAVRGETFLHLLLFFAVLAGYWGLAKVLGNGAAAFLTGLAGTIYVVSFMVKDPALTGGDWAAIGTAMLYGAMLIAVAVASMFLHFMFKVIDGTYDRDASRKEILTIVIEAVMRMVLTLFTGKRG